MIVAKKYATKLLLSTLLILLVCSPLLSTACATSEENADQNPSEESITAADDGPTLYAYEEDDHPILIQENDDAVDQAKNDTSDGLPDDLNIEGDQSLISPRSLAGTTAENTATVIMISALIAAIAIVVTVAITQRGKKQKA